MRYCLLFLVLFSFFGVNCTLMSRTSVATTPSTVAPSPAPPLTAGLPPIMSSRVPAFPVTKPPPTNTPTPPLAESSKLRQLGGNLLNQIADLETNMPKARSDQFVIPSQAEMDVFASLMTNIEAGHSLKAAQLASRQGYELLRYTDRGDHNAQSFLLREIKPIQRGWGLYVVRINPSNNIIIEAPHPLFDRGTSQMALAFYRALDARALLIAGAHRNANLGITADVAHNPINIFHTMHLVLTYAGNPLVLQIHGFSTAKHPHYPQVILNSNQGSSSAELNSLAEALSAEGFQVGICQADRWKDLCGRTNVQLSSMKQGVFIHMELAEPLRDKNKAVLSAITLFNRLSENSQDASLSPR